MPQRTFGPQEARGHFCGDGTLPYVAGVSWPRSGHNLLKRLLDDLLGPRFGYCEYYGPRVNPALACCGAFPCAKAGPISFTKQHDLEGDVPVPDGARLLVQARAFLPSVISHYELTLVRGEVDSALAFRNFAVRRAAAYRAFIAKWVEATPESARVLPYERLTRDCAGALEEALALFNVTLPRETLNAAAARAAAISVANGRWGTGGRGVAATRIPERFRHYDAPLFADLEAATTDAQATLFAHATAPTSGWR